MVKKDLENLDKKYKEKIINGELISDQIKHELIRKVQAAQFVLNKNYLEWTDVIILLDKDIEETYNADND
jgi:hypothetical protein